MLYYDCHYLLFNHGFKYQDCVWNGCHNLTMLCLNESYFAIIVVKGAECRCSKSEGINLLENYLLEDRR